MPLMPQASPPLDVVILNHLYVTCLGVNKATICILCIMYIKLFKLFPLYLPHTTFYPLVFCNIHLKQPLRRTKQKNSILLNNLFEYHSSKLLSLSGFVLIYIINVTNFTLLLNLLFFIRPWIMENNNVNNFDDVFKCFRFYSQFNDVFVSWVEYFHKSKQPSASRAVSYLFSSSQDKVDIT